MKQVKFIDDGNILGGILLDTGEIICGCCGGIIESDEAEIIEIYDDWINISDAIIGE